MKPGRYIIILFGLTFSLAYFLAPQHILYAVDSFTQRYTSSDSRDPFLGQLPAPKPKADEQPNVEPLPVEIRQEEKVVPPVIVVQGLIAGGPVPQAIIGGKILRIGDKIQEATITGITKAGVEVLYKKKSFSFPAPSRALVPTKGGKNVN